jgi:hypothetical protein
LKHGRLLAHARLGRRPHTGVWVSQGEDWDQGWLFRTVAPSAQRPFCWLSRREEGFGFGCRRAPEKAKQFPEYASIPFPLPAGQKHKADFVNLIWALLTVSFGPT